MVGHRAAFLAKKNLPLYDHFRKRGHTLDSAIMSVLEVTDRLLERVIGFMHWIPGCQEVLTQSTIIERRMDNFNLLSEPYHNVFCLGCNLQGFASVLSLFPFELT